MNIPKVFESEYRFCCIVWDNEPVNSTELVKLCKEKLGWAKATTYTVIKRLSERGIIKSENATVTTLYTREEVQSSEVEELIERTFDGSLPEFFAAFVKGRSLSAEEAEKLHRLIDSSKGEK